MRFKWITILSFCLLLTLGFSQMALAQELTPTKTIPITSRGFSAKLSPDGKTLVTFESAILFNLEEVDPTLLPMRVIDISTGEERGQLTGFTDYASDIAFTSGGQRMVSAHMNGDIYVWDVASMKVLKSFQTPLLANIQIRMLPDNKHILTLAMGAPQRFVLIDIDTGAITKTIGTHFDSFMDFQANYSQFPQQSDLMFAGFGVSKDGKLLATASANDEVRIWTIADNQFEVIHPKSDKYGLFSIRQLNFTPDGKSLVYYDSTNMEMHIWDTTAKSETIAKVGGENFVLSPDGALMAWATRAKDAPNTVSIAPVDAPDKAAVVFTIKDGLEVVQRISWLSFTPNGKQLVVGGFFDQDEIGNEIYVLDVPKS